MVSELVIVVVESRHWPRVVIDLAALPPLGFVCHPGIHPWIEALQLHIALVVGGWMNLVRQLLEDDTE